MTEQSFLTTEHLNEMYSQGMEDFAEDVVKLIRDGIEGLDLIEEIEHLIAWRDEGGFRKRDVV